MNRKFIKIAPHTRVKIQFSRPVSKDLDKSYLEVQFFYLSSDNV